MTFWNCSERCAQIARGEDVTPCVVRYSRKVSSRRGLAHEGTVGADEVVVVKTCPTCSAFVYESPSLPPHRCAPEWCVQADGTHRRGCVVMVCDRCGGVGDALDGFVLNMPRNAAASLKVIECPQCLGVGYVADNLIAKALTVWRQEVRSCGREQNAAAAFAAYIAGRADPVRNRTGLGPRVLSRVFVDVPLVIDTLRAAAGSATERGTVLLLHRWATAIVIHIGDERHIRTGVPRDFVRAHADFWREVCPDVVDYLREQPQAVIEHTGEYTGEEVF